ncbi:ImmA/IrrE family metallo-endopeptidase [Microbacterium oleivorans]|uniref:ImmA/IrrE family metallo-endopeptidase n=1 Tax=Microbacterium oleivorans TaxID=273677 RepID=A0A7D5IRQ9_9MICO|nr:ImmA/IrrE family metallo-endopeptidase [Microbacterium oleivorans]QLD10857.1 ImmA/IrrE family metallo-endopeptidase [Microbacterium oleivorans]
MATDDDLIEVLTGLGVSVVVTDLPPDRDGEYEHDARIVRLRPRMARRLHRSVLAHECAHAVHGDVVVADARLAERQERRADEWAAERLITLDDYGWAETLHSGHVEAMAVELDVTVTLVEAFRRVLARRLAPAGS